jgi:hypothetical protein
MGLETTFDFPDDLVETNPASTDSRREGDDHLRGIKKVIRNFSKDLDGAVADTSHMEQIYPVGVVLATLEGPTGPGDVIGGTWEKQGTMTLDTVEAGSDADNNYTDNQIAFHRRTA